MKTIYIYSEIVDDFWARWGFGISAKMVLDVLAGIKDDADLLVRINSPGGFATEAFAIYNALAMRDGLTITQNDGLAASAAGLIFQAGNPRKTFDNADFMMHESYGGGPGQAKDHEKDAERLRNTNGKMAHLYAKKGASDEAKYLAMMADETWIYGQSLVDEGLADEVIDAAASDDDDAKASIRTYVDVDRYQQIFRHAPERVWQRAIDLPRMTVDDRIALIRTGTPPTTDPVAQREFADRLKQEFQAAHTGPPAAEEPTILCGETAEALETERLELELDEALTGSCLGEPCQHATTGSC